MSLVCLGRIGRASGLKGEVRFYPFGETLNSLGTPVKVQIKGKKGDLRPVEITGIRVLPKFLRIKIKGRDTRDDASELSNTEVYIEESRLPDLGEGEHYLYEFVGMDVYAKGSQECIGRVVRAEKYPGADALDVQSDSEEIYTIPLSEGILVSVDKELNRVVVDEEPLGEIL
ncbi:MAG: ribosome maturation factor RimM [Chitinivibrionales bacterium]